MGIDSGLYKVFAIAHVLSVVVAFGPMFVLPRMVTADPAGAARFYTRLVLPALVVLWVLGMGLAGLSDDVWELSSFWLAASIVVWLVLLAVGWFLVRPAITRPEQRSRLQAGIGVTHLLLVVGLWLMVFKPGA